MTETKLNTILPSVNSTEEYEILKKQKGFYENAVKEIIQRHQLPERVSALFSEGTNIVLAHGNERVIKIFPPFHQEQFKAELLVLKHLQGKLSVKTPIVECDGYIFDWQYIVMSQLEGILLENLWERMEHNNKIIIIRELGLLIREVHSLSTYGLEEIDCHWEKFIDKQIVGCVTHHQSMKLTDSLIQQIPSYLEPIKDILFQIEKPVILTGEYTPMNFLVKQIHSVWHIVGLIDFGDAMLGLPEYDLLGPGAFLIQGDKKLLREFLTSYGYSTEAMIPALSYQLMALMLLHRYSNLNVQIRIKNWQDKVSSIKGLEHLVWRF